jgi:D-lactate dehydrogenase
MKIAFFDDHSYEHEAFVKANEKEGHNIVFFSSALTPATAHIAEGFPCVCAFVNDCLNESCLTILAEGGTKLIALRSAGYNHVDLKAATRLGLKVVRVPEYSPYAIAEHAVALIQTLNRKTHRAFNRVREGNFSLDHLVGFDLFGKTVGIVGTGKIGKVFSKIMNGFGCHVLAYDLYPDKSLNLEYVALEELLKRSDIVSLHVPLTDETRHMLNEKTFSLMKDGVMVINTGRGALINAHALIVALKKGKVGAAGLDVYEEEENVFFHDLSGKILTDDILARLMTFPNVLITGHQAFLTREALGNIAETTLSNVTSFEKKLPLLNAVN